ncbi:MAG: NrpR regulatory domain-containing protein [Chloroflexota bacterium]|nr:NrpR regulatory domain-containing protein [Chloroflexota bacterium]
MGEKTREKQLSILSILRGSDIPLSSSRISEELAAFGQHVSERTVRFYLKRMDEDGLTQSIGKRGRHITQKGLSELDSSRIMERAAFMSAKIDQMTYRMDFDITDRSGTVVINITLVEPGQLLERVGMICKVFEKGYAMGQLVALLEPGESIGHITVPEGMVGVGTACSITLNGVLLKYGIPTNSRFGGLLELQGGKPTRFVEIITYDGTSIDPLEVFIRSGMTNYIGAIETGNGRIGASFREFPAESRELVEKLAHKLENVGLGGFVRIGRISQTLLEIPVSEGRVGAIVIGGLNPVSILEETGLRAYSRALAGLIDYNRLFRYEELESRIRTYISGHTLLR